MAVIQVTESDFENEVLKSPNDVLVDFYADWCGPCKMMAPIVEQISNEQDGNVKFVKVNIDENKKLASRYKIMTIPNFMLFKNGENKGSLTGVRSKNELKNLIK